MSENDLPAFGKLSKEDIKKTIAEMRDYNPDDFEIGEDISLEGFEAAEDINPDDFDIEVITQPQFEEEQKITNIERKKRD